MKMDISGLEKHKYKFCMWIDVIGEKKRWILCENVKY